jgi:hypothetical protein
MKITFSTVEKLTVSGVPGFDAIALMIEPNSSTSGKVTITQFNKAWSYYWSHAGTNIKQFLIECSAEYLIGKFSPYLKPEIQDTDEEALKRVLKKEIIRQRREIMLNANRARELWSDATMISLYEREKLFYEVFGDEYWYHHPTKTNHEYFHMEKMIHVIQSALIETEKKATQ